jgi:RHS repeat-associated protein
VCKRLCLWPGELQLNKQIGSATQALHRDHLASVRLVTTNAGVVGTASAYGPYGVETKTITTTATKDSKGYIGERADPELGLLYLNARYYDPALGRFLSPDTYDPLLPGVGVNRLAKQTPYRRPILTPLS